MCYPLCYHMTILKIRRSGKVEEQTVMEYAVANRLSVSFVQKAITQGRLQARKSGKRWLVMADAVIAPKGEKATEQVVPITTGDNQQVGVVDKGATEGDELDKETARVDKEIALLDKRKEAAEKRLLLDGHITWDEFQAQRDELRKDREAVRASEAKVSGDKAAISKRERSLDDWERGIKGEIAEAEEWLNRVRVLGRKADEIIADFVATITYDKNMAEQYLVDERHPQWTKAGKMLSMQGVRYRLDDLVKLISDFTELPEPNFSALSGEDEPVDTEVYDAVDEQEPDEVYQDDILEQVEQEVDKEVEKVPAVEPEIVPKKMK